MFEEFLVSKHKKSLVFQAQKMSVSDQGNGQTLYPRIQQDYREAYMEAISFGMKR